MNGTNIEQKSNNFSDCVLICDLFLAVFGCITITYFYLYFAVLYNMITRTTGGILLRDLDVTLVNEV